MTHDDLGPSMEFNCRNMEFLNMENAGLNVGLDLESPIDCSQMHIRQISDESGYNQFSGRMEIKRTTILHAYVINDKGEREELAITFELLSQRRPELKK